MLCESAFGGYSIAVGATGAIDAAVYYPSLVGYPGNAVFVDRLGALSLGDSVAMNAVFAVDDDGMISPDSFGGSFVTATYSGTFGNNFIEIIFEAEHTGYFLAPGEYVYNTDIIQFTGIGLLDNSFNTVSAILTLYGDAGALINPDGTVRPGSVSAFRDAVGGMQLTLDVPNESLSDTFVTDPTYTIAPAPGVLGAMGLGGLLAARRRRTGERKTA